MTTNPDPTLQPVAQALHRFAFSDPRLDALTLPATGRAWVYDTDMPGLACMLTAAGKRTFYLSGRFNGKPTRMRLGNWPTLKADDARRACRALAGQLATGVDVQGQRRAERERLEHERRQEKTDERTVDAVWKAWQQERMPQLRPRTARSYTLWWRTALSSLGDRRVESITTADAAALFNTTANTHGKVTANRMRTLGRMLWRFAMIRWTLALHDPWLGIRPYEESARNRTLSPDEMSRLLAAAEHEDDTARDLIRLLVWTGARINNVRTATWADIDLIGGVWTIPAWRAKGRRPVVLPLVPDAVGMLRARRVRCMHAAVFASDKGTVIDHRKPWRRCCARAGIEGATPHDVRRGMASALTAAGVALPLVSRLLGHASTQITQDRYIRLGADDVRRHVDALAARLAIRPHEQDTGATPAVG